jgi:hypothetical protein
MRSGDRPGLQNRRSLSHDSDGGFDSHSLPPSVTATRFRREPVDLELQAWYQRNRLPFAPDGIIIISTPSLPPRVLEVL